MMGDTNTMIAKKAAQYFCAQYGVQSPHEAGDLDAWLKTLQAVREKRIIVKLAPEKPAEVVCTQDQPARQQPRDQQQDAQLRYLQVLDQLLDLIKTKGFFTIQDAMKHTGLSKSVVQKHVQKAMDQHVLARRKHRITVNSYVYHYFLDLISKQTQEVTTNHEPISQNQMEASA